MRKYLILLLILLPILSFADEVTYPTADTAILNGKTYRLKHASPIYQKLEEA